MKSFLTSSIGKKLVMGVAGLLLVGFVVIHLSGNFLLYIGFQNYNDYAHAIHSTKLLYVAEVILLLLFVTHIYLAIQITRENRKARLTPYEVRKSKQGNTSWTPSAVMFVSGAIVLGFVLLHLSEFRFELRLPGDPGEEPAMKALRILQNPISASVYFIGSLLLGWHLWHGFQSSFQTFGLNHPKYTPWIKKIGVLLALVLGLGFASFPVWAFLKKWGGPVMALDSKVPSGPLTQKWEKHKCDLKLVSPNNKHKFDIIVVGTGLAGASAAASLAELGYNVKAFCFQDSARRAHSIAAQGGINAAKNYQNDGDSVFRLFYDTIKGGDFRAREANVYRLAEVSGNIIDQCVAQGVPFAREYGGTLANRTFGGALVSRTFYARGQTGQQLLLGAYSSLMRQVDARKVQMYPRREMLDLVVVDGTARGIIVRNLITGAYEKHAAHAVILATGGYGNAYYLSTNAKGCNVTAAWRAHKRGAFFANPCFTQIHPTCIPVSGDYQSKLTLMSESLRNDGRVWVPKNKGDKRPPHEIPDSERDYYLERKYPTYGNMVPRDVASRNAKAVCDEGRGVGTSGMAVYLDFANAIKRDGMEVIREKYGNLFHMYQKITDEDPYQVPMRIYPAVHYTMGGLWVDYNLESNLPGLFVLGEANFSDHGANRLGASALMQGLADGYFIAPYTVGNHLASRKLDKVTEDHPAFTECLRETKTKIDQMLAIKGKRSVESFHRELGQIMWNYCGMSRNEQGLKTAIEKICALRNEFWQSVKVTGEEQNFNQDLEHAGRVADFLEFAELLAADALHRKESCGGHFREESQTEENEAKRDDQNFSYAAAWEFQGVGKAETLHKEPLSFETVQPSQRSYK